MPKAKIHVRPAAEPRERGSGWYNPPGTVRPSDIVNEAKRLKFMGLIERPISLDALINHLVSGSGDQKKEGDGAQPK